MVQAVNTLQKSICDREKNASPIKVNSGSVLRITKSVMELQGEALRKELEQCIPLVSLANEKEMEEFLGVLKTVVKGLIDGNGLCVWLKTLRHLPLLLNKHITYEYSTHIS